MPVYPLFVCFSSLKVMCCNLGHHGPKLHGPQSWVPYLVYGVGDNLPLTSSKLCQPNWAIVPGECSDPFYYILEKNTWQILMFLGDLQSQYSYLIWFWFFFTKESKFLNKRYKTDLIYIAFSFPLLELSILSLEGA